MTEPAPENPSPTPHRRRPRYSGKNPRRYEDKYKEHNPERYAETVAKVRAAGKTPAGQHVPILLPEILTALRLQPGARVVDCTLGYGGHATELLKSVQPERHTPGPRPGPHRDPAHRGPTCESSASPRRRSS